MTNFFFDRGLATVADIRTFVETSCQAAGLTKDYEVGNAVGFKVTNDLVGTGTDAFFTPVFIFNAAEVVLSLAIETTTGSATGLISEANAIKMSGLIGPFDVYLVATNKRVAIQIFDKGTGNRDYLCATSMDYRLLDVGAISGDATHESNLKNNGQCLIGSASPLTPRLLYSGNLAENSEFGELGTINTSAPDVSPFLNSQVSGVVVGVPIVLSEADEFLGSTSGVFLSSNSALFNLDVGVSGTGTRHRVFKSTSTTTALLVRES